MKRLFLFLIFLCLAISSFGQFRNGMVDWTGGKPVYRKDLNYHTAPTLLCADDCRQFLLGNRLFKAGTISAACGLSVATVSAAVLFGTLGSETISLISSYPKGGGSGVDTTKVTMYKWSSICCYVGAGVAFVGVGLMIAGSAMEIKIANKYFRGHPYGELSVKASPTSLGLALNF